jgi:hypothetical protein
MVTDLGDVCKKVWMNPKELLGILTSDAVQFHWLASQTTNTGRDSAWSRVAQSAKSQTPI